MFTVLCYCVVVLLYCVVQFRVLRLFVDKALTVVSRGFQLKHMPSGEVSALPHPSPQAVAWLALFVCSIL